MGFYDPNSGKIDVSSQGYFISKCFEATGEDYRQKVSPEEIKLTTEPTEIPATALELYYSDGTAKGKIVPEGTLLSNGKTQITQEMLDTQYEPYMDESGEIIENMYIRIIKVRVLKNPFGLPVVKTNSNGYIISEGDSECYLVWDSLSDRFGYSIITPEQLEELYVPINSESKKL